MILFLPFNTFWHEFHCVWHLKITIVQLPSWCPTLSDPMDCSLPSSSTHGIFQARVLELCLTLCNAMDCKLPCSSPSPRVCPSSCPLNRWCHPTISSSVALFSCLQPFPASGSFPLSQLLASGGQCFGASASASVLPKNIQGWFLFKINWFDLLPFQETLKRLLQDHMFLVPTWL